MRDLQFTTTPVALTKRGAEQSLSTITLPQILATFSCARARLQSCRGHNALSQSIAATRLHWYKEKRAAGFNRRPVQKKRVGRECYWSGVVDEATRAAVNGTLPLPVVFWKIVPRWSVPNERPPVEPAVSGCASPK